MKLNLKQCCPLPNVIIKHADMLNSFTGERFLGDYLSCQSCLKRGEGFKPLENGTPDFHSIENDWNSDKTGFIKHDLTSTKKAYEE